jgi:hypothetical protein
MAGIMALSPSTLPQSTHLVHVRLPPPERGDPVLRDVFVRLAGLRDEASWCAAILALLATSHNRRERAAWRIVAPAVPEREQLFDGIATLTPPHRLPWLEHFARSLAPGPVQVRQELIGNARRLMTSDGLVSPIDQLRWVALRHMLAGSAVAPPVAAQTELAELDVEDAHCICIFSAFLSRLVPTTELTVDLDGEASVSQIWYDKVVAPWQGRFEMAPRDQHDIDAALRALRVVQSLPWLLRPVLVRSWYVAASELTEGPALHPDSADALRLVCTLLDSPVPPELNQQYVEVETARS